MKFRCSCGEVLRDQSDRLPHKAHLVADNDFLDLHNRIDQLIADGPDDPDALTRVTLEYWRDLYQCPRCGHLYLAAGEALHEFIPAHASTPRDLLTGSRTSLLSSEAWMNFSDPSFSATKLAWEQELRQEVAKDHPLFERTWGMIARRDDRDDALLDLRTGGYAVVHLTWSGRPEQPPWPTTTVYPSLRAVAAHYREDLE